MTAAVTFHDRRKAGAPICLDPGAALAALAAADVDLEQPGLELRVELRDTTTAGKHGFTRTADGKRFLVVVYALPKDAWLDRRLYPLANSLVHELRHVAQHQQGMSHDDYAAASAANGYHGNPFEVEARYYGRRADHKGVKDTGPAGPALGKAVWAWRAP